MYAALTLIYGGVARSGPWQPDDIFGTPRFTGRYTSPSSIISASITKWNRWIPSSFQASGSVETSIEYGKDSLIDDIINFPDWMKGSG